MIFVEISQKKSKMSYFHWFQGQIPKNIPTVWTSEWKLKINFFFKIKKNIFIDEMGSKSDFWSSFDFNSNIYIEIKNKKIWMSERPNVRTAGFLHTPNVQTNARMSERQGFFTKYFYWKGCKKVIFGKNIMKMHQNMSFSLIWS